MSEIISGIYCFENLVNGKKYIGQSTNLDYRLFQHSYFLKGNYDGCIALQHAWNLYGSENFYFHTIEQCPIDLLNEREQFWIKELNSHISEWGYNISWGGDAFFRGRHHSEESRRKISEHSGAKKGKDSPSYGRCQSEEEKRRQSEAQTGRQFSEETKLKISRSNNGKKRGKNTTSKYIGVYYRKDNCKWRTSIRVEGKVFNIGQFDLEVDAALAYNKAFIELCGKNIDVNIIE